MLFSESQPVLTYMFIAAVFAAIFRSASANFSEVCRRHNADDELKFVLPEGLDVSTFPPPYYITVEGSGMAALCCGTGFIRISWRVNGSIPIPDEEPYRFYLYDEDQLFYFREVPYGITYVECTLHNETGQTISNKLTINAELNVKPITYKPEFTVLPQNQCVKPGENVTVKCQAEYDKPATRAEMRIQLTLANETMPIGYGGHVTFHPSRNETVVNYEFYFTNITEQWIDVNYSCRVGISGRPSAYFTLETCQEPTVKTSYRFEDSKTTLIISLSVLGGTIALLVTTVLVAIYNPEARVLWNTRITSNCCILGKRFDYDIFMIYGNDDYDQIKDMIEELEKRYKLCLPSRDFEFGTAVAHQTIQKLKASRVALAVLSNGIFLQECWTDSQIQMTLKVNRPIYFVKLEALSKDELNLRAMLRAGLNVCPTVDFPPDCPKSWQMAEFYRKLYKILPKFRSQGLNDDSPKFHDTNCSEV